MAKTPPPQVTKSAGLQLTDGVSMGIASTYNPATDTVALSLQVKGYDEYDLPLDTSSDVDVTFSPYSRAWVENDPYLSGMIYDAAKDSKLTKKEARAILDELVKESPRHIEKLRDLLVGPLGQGNEQLPEYQNFGNIIRDRAKPKTRT